MNYKRLGWIAVLLVVLIFPVSASMISFLVVETGLNEANPSTDFGSLWEGALMSSFFEAGHIVTNSPIMRMEKKPAQDLTGMVEIDFNQAALGGAEYFVLGYLNHEIRERGVVPVDITIKTYKINNKELIFEQSFPVGSARNQREEFQFAKNAGQFIVSRIRGR
jgi:hypothetical protein